MLGSITKVSAVALLMLLAACGSSPQHGPVLGEAYVGPATLKIRGDIPLESATVATVRHGDRLEILQRRRRFLRVRTPRGAEGWTDERQLLSSAEMASLRDLGARAAKMPPQGQGTSFGGDLNLHTQPDRMAPSFLQVKEKEKVDVLASLVLPRVAQVRKPLLPRAPKKAKVARKPAKEPKYPLPPVPKPPPAPAGWLELSKTAPAPEAQPAPEESQAEANPVVVESWSLVRTAAGQTGWALTRRIHMSIPDEVAQYAEGRRIVSYFALAETDDGGEKKQTWLWTTSPGGAQPFDFDSFRVFVWSLRRHRYETAYIERNLQGYAPVLLRDVNLATGARPRAGQAAATDRYPGFSICTLKSDGQRVRREFALLGNIVRAAGESPCEVAPDLAAIATPAAAGGSGPVVPRPDASGPPAGGLGQRIRNWLRGLAGRLKG